MPIKFTCTNILQYDAVNNRYEQCGASLEAAESDSGNQIKCVSCNQWTSVPVSSTISAQSQPQAQPAPPTASPSAAVVSPSGNASPKVDSHIAVEAAPLTDTMSEFDQEFASNDASSFGSASQLQFDSFSVQRRCPRCDSVIDKSGKCTQCKYGREQVVDKNKDVPLEHIETKTAGCSLWLQSFLGENTSLALLATAIYVLFGVLAAMCGLAGLMIGGPLIILVAMVIAPFAICGVYMMQYWIRMNSKPAVPLQFWQRVPWEFLLSHLRSNSWNRSKDKIVDLSDQKMYDSEIATTPGIGRAEVVDLEGTELTDEGLLQLYQFRQIRCLVVRYTKVTPEGVFRLQQHNRKMWIWS